MNGRSFEFIDMSYMTSEDVWAGVDFEKNAITTYLAYGAAVGGKTWDGKPIPSWHEIKARQRNGWREAVKTSIREYLDFEHRMMVEMELVKWQLPETVAGAGAASH